MTVQQEMGNALLELILVLPVVFLLLFVGFDCALALIQRGEISDGVRSAANEQAILYREQIIDDEVPERILAALNAKLSRETSFSRNGRQLSLRADLIAFDIDPPSGRLLGYRVIQSSQANVEDGPPSEVSGTSSPLLQNEYFSEQPSRFARPRTLMLEESKRFFSPRASALALTIVGETKGLPQNPFRIGFQNIFRIEEFRLIPVRQYGEW